MNYKSIKNKVAFKEVLKNNGYSVDIIEKNIDITNKRNKKAYIDTDSTRNKINIKVLDKNINLSEAKELLAEIRNVIDIYGYIEDNMEL